MMLWCNRRYSGLSLLKRRNGSINSGGSLTKDMVKAPY